MNNSSHSSLSDAPVHQHKPQLSGAGYLTLSPLSYFEWDDKEPSKAPPSPLSPSAVGAFVTKAKAILKGKRNSWQSPSTEPGVVRPLIHRAQTFRQSKPAVPRRQSTDPILPNQPVVAGTSRPSRRRTGGSMQIGPPQLIHSTMFPEFAQDSSPLAPRCTPTPPPMQISPRARGARMLSLGSLSTMLEHVQSPTETTRAHCGEFDHIPRSVSGSTALSCPAPGTKVGPAQTFRGYPGGKRSTTLSSSSCNNINRARSRLLEGLDLGVSETMVAISEAGLLHDSGSSNNEPETSMLYTSLSRMLASFDDSDRNSTKEDDGSNSSHHLVDEPLELGEDTLHSVRSPEQGESSTSVNSDSGTLPSRPMTMDKCLEHMTASPPGSLLTPWRALQLTRSRFEIQSLKGPQRVEIVPNETCVAELQATIAGPSNVSSGSKTLLSAPPAIPVRSARRPVSRSSSYVSEHSVASVPVVPVTDVNGISAAGKARQDAHDTFIEPKITYAIKGKKRSHKRMSKTKTRPSNYKRIAKQQSGEWIVVPTLPRTTRTLYASSSSTRLGSSQAPRSRSRGRIVKSPSIRSGLVRHGGSGRRSSRSRSRVSIKGAFSTSHSTRSLPGHSNSKAKGKAVEGFPVRPPRSRARPRLDLGDGGKENLPTSPRIDDDLPRCEPSRPTRAPLNTGVSGARCSDESTRRPVPPRNPARAALRV